MTCSRFSQNEMAVSFDFSKLTATLGAVSFDFSKLTTTLGAVSFD